MKDNNGIWQLEYLESIPSEDSEGHHSKDYEELEWISRKS